MGKPQGDGLPEPTYYEREVDGELVTRPAYVPADHVNLQARGWRAKSNQGDPHAAAVAATEKHAGSQQRGGVKVASQQQAGAPEAGASSA